jgi:hypothetical protein
MFGLSSMFIFNASAHILRERIHRKIDTSESINQKAWGMTSGILNESFEQQKEGFNIQE